MSLGNIAGRSPIRVLVAGHRLNFAQLLIDHLERDPRYSVEIDDWMGVSAPPETWNDKSDSADLIFCEWAHRNAAWYSHHKRPEQALVVRLHHFEFEQNILPTINWEAVDRLILVTPYCEIEVLNRFPELKGKTQVVRNLVDEGALQSERTDSQAIFRLGILGYLPMRKEPHLGLSILERLLEVDPRYQLNFKGNHPWDQEWVWRREKEQAYYRRFYADVNRSSHRDAIEWGSRIPDIADWYARIGFVLSTSNDETCHLAIAEGMAAGCYPIIRSWPDADWQYPGELTLPFAAEAFVETAVKKILSLRDAVAFAEATDATRRYARATFDTRVVMPQFDAIFADSVAQLSGAPSGG